jgi:glycosyltransferase involved in cell wall biosynthesis
MESLPHFHLDLFGEGAEAFKKYLRQCIHEAGVDEMISFHGFVSWDKLVEAMHQSDIFVFPSIWDEPFASAPLQAQGCGLPVVATRAGGTPEGFVDGQTALLVPPNDPQATAEAIARLVLDDSLRLRLRENGIREVVAQWSFEAYLERLLDFYQRVEERWRESRG